MKKLNLVGEVYYFLTVLERADPINEHPAWKCRCKCGNIKVIKQDHLRRKDNKGTKSCGCWNNIQRSARAKKMYSVRQKYTPQEATARRVWKNRYHDIPFEDFMEISQQNCYYCNLAPSNSNCQNVAGDNSSVTMKEDGYFYYNGLDRIDNNLTHTKENCIPCCWTCNAAKTNMSQEEFGQWICQVYHHWAKQYDKSK